jgi:hypothetical protein
MPQLVFPIDPDGLLVHVVVGLCGLTTTRLMAAGQPITAPVSARGAIDTGTDVTAVSAAILQRLSVAAVNQKTTQTVSGQLNVQMFVVSIGITDFGNQAAPELIEPDLTVMELVTILPTAIEVLIGLDVLRSCRFLLDGPGAWFSLDF